MNFQTHTSSLEHGKDFDTRKIRDLVRTSSRASSAPLYARAILAANLGTSNSASDLSFQRLLESDKPIYEQHAFLPCISFKLVILSFAAQFLLRAVSFFDLLILRTFAIQSSFIVVPQYL